MEQYGFLGLPQSQWEFINSFGDWFSAIGTVAAVVVSLYLARRAGKPRAKLRVGIRLLVEAGAQGDPPEYLAISLVNTGDRPIRITGVGWKFGWLRHRYAIQMLGTPPLSSPLPIDLQHGEEAKWFIPMNARDGGWFRYFAKDLLMPNWRMSLRTITLQAYSSVGVVFSAKPEPNLIEKLKPECEALANEK